MVLKSCRCCCSTIRLEKAAKIIGIIFTILGAISLVWSIVLLYKLDSNYDLLRSQMMTLLPEEIVDEILQHSRTTLVVRLVIVLLFTLFSALLVAGVQRNSKPMVLTFVVFFVLYMIVSTIAIFYAFYDPSIIIDQESITKLNDESMAKVVIYSSLAITLAIIAFFWYLAVVVYSYYKAMGSGTGRTPEHCQLN